jgi:hypothetical protein
LFFCVSTWPSPNTFDLYREVGVSSAIISIDQHSEKDQIDCQDCAAGSGHIPPHSESNYTRTAMANQVVTAL